MRKDTKEKMKKLGFQSRRSRTDLQRFLKRNNLNTSDLQVEKMPAVRVALGEWSHQRRAGRRSRSAFAVAEFGAPLAAATATVLAAFKSTREWAVIPAAVATLFAALLAGFGFEADWRRRREVRHELGPEIVAFIMDWGEYGKLDATGKLDAAGQVNRLMCEVRKAARSGSEEVRTQRS